MTQPESEQPGVGDVHETHAASQDLDPMTPSGRNWVVDGLGRVITRPDGTPVDGRRVSEVQRRAGRPMSNREAAAHVMSVDEWVGAVRAELDRLVAEDEQTGQSQAPEASAPQPDSQLRPAVDMPDSIPTGSRVGQSKESYAIGIPPSPSPSWVPEAVQLRIERLRGDGTS